MVTHMSSDPSESRKISYTLEDLAESYGGTTIESEVGPKEQGRTQVGTWEDLEFTEATQEISNKAKDNIDIDKRLENPVLNPERNILFIDDHQHALAGWTAYLDPETLYDDQKVGLLHLDRHPDHEDPGSIEIPENIEEAEKRIADQLSISEYIRPAEEWNLIEEVETWGINGDISTEFFDEERDYDETILNLDLDVFYEVACQMHLSNEYQPEEYEEILDTFYTEIADLMHEADFVTVATSPGYIPQDTAKMHLEEVMNRYEEKEGRRIGL
jgi:hypothetical protein